MEDRVLNKKSDEERLEEKKAKVIFQGIAFLLNESVYSLDVMFIQSIIVATKIYKVPNTNRCLLGVLNLRGNILPIYSIKRILGIEDDVADGSIIEEEEKFIVMIKKEKDVFGVMIDGGYKNIVATEDNYKTGKYIERWSKNVLFSGVVLEDDKEILAINIDNLLKYIISLK